MKGKQKIVKSDHNLMVASFNIQFQSVNYQKPRRVLFNLKNKECQEIFTEVSENNFKLRKCFKSHKSFPEQCNMFFKTLDGMMHQCFRKVRVRKMKENTEIQVLLDEKMDIQISMEPNMNKENLTDAQDKIIEIEKKISKLCADKNCEIVRNHIQNLRAPNGNFSQLGMWKLKNQLVPKDIDPPMAKKDCLGNLITAPETQGN